MKNRNRITEGQNSQPKGAKNMIGMCVNLNEFEQVSMILHTIYERICGEFARICGNTQDSGRFCTIFNINDSTAPRCDKKDRCIEFHDMCVWNLLQIHTNWFSKQFKEFSGI